MSPLVGGYGSRGATYRMFTGDRGRVSRNGYLVPLDRMPDLGALVGGVDVAFVSIFASAIQVAGPVVLALALTDAAFGLVSRVVPQLNVFGVGFPAKVTVGLLLIGVSLPFVAGWLADGVQGATRRAFLVVHEGHEGRVIEVHDGEVRWVGL